MPISPPSTVRRPSLAAAACAIVGLAYPVLVYYGVQYLPPVLLAAALVALMLGRLALVWHRRAAGPLDAALLPVTAVLLLLLAVDPALAMKAYPALISGGLALLFAHSLLVPPPMIERLARLQQDDLPPEASRYLRGVTLLWLGFFLINGGIASWTALFGTLEQWTLYNGLISYLVIGTLFAAEWLVRGLYRRAQRRDPVL